MANIYINADTGNDTTGDGSAGSPYLTLGKAHTEAASGDTVICQKSTASYAFTNINFTKNLNIQGESPVVEDQIFDGAGQIISWHWSLPGLTINISKLTFQNALSQDTAGNFGEALFQYFDDTSTLPTVASFTDCIFRDLNIGCGRNTGGMFGGNDVRAHNFIVTLTRCVFYRVRKRADSVATNGVWLFGQWGVDPNSRLNIINCSLHFDGAGATAFDKFMRVPIAPGSGSTLTITNTIIQAGGDTLDFGEDYSSNILSFSCFNNMTSVPPASASITDDPLFVDPINGNLKLRPGSPCSNTGVIL